MKAQAAVTAVLGVLVALAPYSAFAAYGDVSASVTASTTAGEHRAEVKANAQANMEDRAHTRAEQEIERRIKGLNGLMARINGAKRIGDDNKSSLSATLNAQIALMNDLDAKIKADTDADTLKADIQSITKAYRVFILVMPQGAIMAAADRIKFVAGQMETLSAKIKTRLDGLTSGGTDVSASLTLLTDANAKIADAKVQAQAAIDLVVNLKPDNGDTTIQASNTAALKDARAKIQAGQADLKTAREDFRKIMVNVKGKGEAHATTTTP